MAFSIRLDPATERTITRLSRRRGTTRANVVREAVAVYAATAAASGESVSSAYDALAPFIGAVDSGGSRRSEDTGSAFKRLMVRKARARRSR